MAEPAKTSRRDFLSGKSAAAALVDAVAPPPEPLPLSKTVGTQPGSHLLSVSREAMACLFEVVFDAATYRDHTEAAVAALELLEPLEAQLTVYRDHSEVMQVNRRAAAAAAQVEAGLFHLLQRAAALSAETDGAFDITAGRLSKVWGFYRRQGQMPSADEITAALATVGCRHLQLDDRAQTVRITQPGLELNLGSIGKGYALDRVAEALAGGGIENFLFHGGNSSVLARGGRNSEFRIQNSEQASWTVALKHPLKPDVRLAEFDLSNQALGTSGSGTQFFHYQGKRYGHILDPRSGWPAEQALSATVIAPTAEQADALSTAFYVLGVQPAQAWCERHAEVSTLLVTSASAAGGIALHPINLTDSRWRRLQ